MLRTLHPIRTDGKKLNVCAYARVSADKYDAEMSLDNQISYYTTLILNNPNWEYCGVYADEAVTGTSTDKREQFKNMVAKGMKGLIDIILVKSISRFGRNITDVISAINDLRTMGVEVFFERENISTLDATSTVALSLYAQLAESEVKSMSENVKWAIDKRMKKGKYRIPVEEMLGYTYDGNGNLVIVENEAKIIQQIFSMYIQRISLLTIARTMEKEGYLTGIGSPHWNEKTITRILINEKYVGDCHLQKEFIDKMSSRTSVVNRGERDSYYIKDAHPAIIDRETWEKACELRAQRRIKYNKPLGGKRAKPKTETSFCVCPYCGKNYFIKRLANAKSGIKYTLNCSSNRSTLTCRESESVFVEDLKDIVLELITTLQSNPIRLKSELKKALSIDDKPIRFKINSLNEEIDRLRTKLTCIKDNTSDSFRAIRDEIGIEIENLTSQKKKLENDLLTQLDYETKRNEIINIVNSLSSTDRNQNYRVLLKKAIINSRTDITFIIGNEDISCLNLLELPRCFESEHKIKVRGQFYIVKYGVFFNR